MNLAALRAQVEAGQLDTVLLAMTDMQGRLQGKRLTARHFLDEIAEHGAEACSYLLAVDVEMTPVEGYAMTSWERGYGDFVLHPDLATLRLAPWLPGTALVIADIAWADADAHTDTDTHTHTHGHTRAHANPVAASPRQILEAQLARLAERGWAANAGTELEFLVFRDTYEEAWSRGYRDLSPANLYNVDYSLLGTARVEPLIRRIRRAMEGAGLHVEDSKGECNLGQHEINFRYRDALGCADDHVIYKNAAKEIAAQENCSISFMAKFNEREGSSCHIHFSLAEAAPNSAAERADTAERAGPAERAGMARDGIPLPGEPLFARDEGLFHSFLAGQLACLRELTLLFAPNVNSYKRYAAGSFAPTAIAWGHDNRTCALRVVGHGPSLRFENRAGGSDLNPYLALSATIAAGLYGVEHGLELEPAYAGNAYGATEKPRLPRTLKEARDAFAASAVARDAFGEEVVEHYLHAADIELAAFEAAVTDWERIRGFERL